jgi:hypothetical protein
MISNPGTALSVIDPFRGLAEMNTIYIVRSKAWRPISTYTIVSISISFVALNHYYTAAAWITGADLWQSRWALRNRLPHTHTNLTAILRSAF